MNDVKKSQRPQEIDLPIVKHLDDAAHYDGVKVIFEVLECQLAFMISMVAQHSWKLGI